jgi:hypothetical protein
MRRSDSHAFSLFFPLIAHHSAEHFAISLAFRQFYAHKQTPSLIDSFSNIDGVIATDDSDADITMAPRLRPPSE